MNRTALFVLLVSMGASAEAPKSEPSSQTMKDTIKDAANPNGAVADPGPDVSNMPFTADSIRQVVTHHHPRVIACYEEVLASSGKAMEGVLMTHFVINGDGLVTGAKILKKGSTLDDRKLNDCVVAVISTMSFPKPPDGKNHPVEFPFKLTAIH